MLLRHRVGTLLDLYSLNRSPFGCMILASNGGVVKTRFDALRRCQTSGGATVASTGDRGRRRGTRRRDRNICCHSPAVRHQGFAPHPAHRGNHGRPQRHLCACRQCSSPAASTRRSCIHGQRVTSCTTTSRCGRIQRDADDNGTAITCLRASARDDVRGVGCIVHPLSVGAAACGANTGTHLALRCAAGSVHGVDRIAVLICLAKRRTRLVGAKV